MDWSGINWIRCSALLVLRQPGERFPFVAVIAIFIFLPGCSLFFLESGQAPKVYGFGSVQDQPIEHGRLFKVSMPGIGLRYGYPNAGISIGWHQSLVFCSQAPDGAGALYCFANQDTGVGLDVYGYGLTLGVYRSLQIARPADESVFQQIRYSEDSPEKTWIERRSVE